jgi:hypothetical protein
MSSLPLTGGCLCGAVRFEVDEPPIDAGYCHCTRCQRRTGTAASPSATLAPGSLRLLHGADHLGHWRPPDGGFLKFFCRECGAHLYSQSPTDPQAVGVRFGAFDAPPPVRPRYRMHLASAAPWEPIPDDGTVRYDGPRVA